MNLKTIFPKASQSFIDANQMLYVAGMGERTAPAPRTLPRAKMNRTETEFARILDGKKRRGEIVRYEYQGITLRWLGMKYTPDFVVVKTVPIECEKCGKVQTVWLTYFRLIEVKGAHIWDRDIVRFKGASASWPEFNFEMWQKKNGCWNRMRDERDNCPPFLRENRLSG